MRIDNMIRQLTAPAPAGFSTSVRPDGTWSQQPAHDKSASVRSHGGARRRAKRVLRRATEAWRWVGTGRCAANVAPGRGVGLRGEPRKWLFAAKTQRTLHTWKELVVVVSTFLLLSSSELPVARPTTRLHAHQSAAAAAFRAAARPLSAWQSSNALINVASVSCSAS